MAIKKSLSSIKKQYDKELKKLEGRDECFRNDRYNVYFKPEVFFKEILSKMKKEDRCAYCSGAGGEIRETFNKNGKPIPASMSSVGSSSRFCYLSLKDSDLSVFGIKKTKQRITFEEKLPINGVKSGIPPHMDAYYHVDGDYYFFECKCHEQFDDHELLLSKSYFGINQIVDKIDRKYRLNTKKKTNSRTGKESIYFEYSPEAFGLPNNPRFDIKQLLTHIMGIDSKIKSEIKSGKLVSKAQLIYFYFIPDAILENPDIKSVIDELYKEVRIAFENVRKLCSTNIEFKLYVFHGKRVETASTENVHCEI